MANLKSNDLIKIFENELIKSHGFEYLEKGNPCHLIFDGIEFYIYVKNLSSAHFANEDVWRAQLTGIDMLKTIKDSDDMFVMLGYDSENEVYATWNPYIMKQRIGTAASPSFYSRRSWQEEASKTNEFVFRELKNDGAVLIFPKELLPDFLGNINKYFSDSSDYVALGSKRRAKANEAYKIFTNKNNFVSYAKYLVSLFCDVDCVEKYVSAVKVLINNYIRPRYRKVFLQYDNICQYNEAVEQFLASDEIKCLDSTLDNVYSYALTAYVEFVINEFGETNETETSPYPEVDDENDGEYVSDSDIEESNEQDKKIDYETPYLDSDGRLTKISNPKLIEMLRPDLDTEFPRPMAAFATIEDFYGSRFPKMEMFHWQKLFNAINWSKEGETIPKGPVKYELPARIRSARHKIRILFPDGSEVCEKKVVDTLLAVIKYATLEKVLPLKNLRGNTGGGQLITKTVIPKYKNAFKPIGQGYYVNTHSNTQTKLSQIQQINTSLNLGLKISLV